MSRDLSQPLVPTLAASLITLCLNLFLALSGVATAATQEKASDPPPLRAEFRAAWIATVANIDWPSKPGLSTQQQQDELIALLDSAAKLKLNAIIFQVRPHCDALYASKLEPWSEYLTGVQGKAPAPYYDPLEFAIEQAHRRGMELHAWFNPYRASHPSGKSELSADHIKNVKPDAVRKYGKYLWLDPGDQQASDHSVAVILDVVKRYDVDGVHFDDYFYPYPINDKQGKRVDFPDDASWQAAQAAGVELSRDDWRRQNVDQLIHRLAIEIKQEKPWVKFGISPFGIWRPGHPQGVVGFDAYESLYADSRKWFQDGDLDYLTPQLYWRLNSVGQSYAALLRWWQEQNAAVRHLWPGNYTSKLFGTGKNRWPGDEIPAQVWATRAQEGAGGNVHFSMKALAQNAGGVADLLAAGPYREPALIPASPWMATSETERPNKPKARVSRKRSSAVVRMQFAGSERPTLWVIQARYGSQWVNRVVSASQELLEIPLQETFSGELHKLEEVVVSAVDRIGRQSPGATVTVSSR